MLFNLQDLVQRHDNLEELDATFTREEIDKIIQTMPSDKSLGPDGFNGMFLKKCWHIIKEDFYELCQNFHEGH